MNAPTDAQVRQAAVSTHLKLSPAWASAAGDAAQVPTPGSDTLTIQGNTNPSEWFVDDVSVLSGAPSAVPLPATLPLFATGLAGLGLLGWRRKRKAIAA